VAKGKKRRVLLIVGDQWRWDCLSAMGHPVVKTPHLDALAAEGVLFRKHFGQCSPCGPARTVRGCGLTPLLFGYSDTAADPRLSAAADPALTSYEGVMPGFDVGVCLNDKYAAWRARLIEKGYELPKHPKGVFATEAESGHAHSLRPTIYTAADSLSAFLADELLSWIEVHPKRSWLAYVTFLHPHPPLVAPAPYNALYDPADCPAPLRCDRLEQEDFGHPFLKWYHGEERRLKYHRELALDTATLPIEEVRRIRATYYGLISEVDDQIGRIVAELKAEGLYDQTLIIFTIDHGEMLGDRWMFGKECVFDPAFRVPLIIRDPRRKADAARGRRVDDFTESVDLMPTILDWLGAEIPAGCDGASLLPFLRGERPASWRDAAHWEYDFRDPVTQTAERALGLTSDQCNASIIRDERYKYVHFAALPPLLYDMLADPAERTNLAEDPAHREVALRYAQRLLSWRMVHAERTLANHMLTDQGLYVHRGPRSL
jgi:arylsulfatase A-like enzyme